MAQADLLQRRAFGQTSRRDAWWLAPLGVFVALGSFIVYATWAAFQNAHYTHGPYLSPFYSPEMWGSSSHAWFQGKPSFWPDWLSFSPAFLVLWAPGGFRLTCYYYRGAYYKAFWADPPSCAVGEPRKSYRGEHSFPLILQNVHRYFLYASIGLLLILSYDVWKALWFLDPATGQTRFGIGVGTLVLAANVYFLGSYALGCHSLRHLLGGRIDVLSKRPGRQLAWRCSSCLNRRHQVFAWCSLFSVAFSDLYVRLCSMGIWSDWRLL
ncbi:MAG TPA: succinate dehydrogenase [Thermoanaerobaculia bacterium]|nr:succinate dehydrogenase [Thermoanaerobaculia bacterium]